MDFSIIYLIIAMALLILFIDLLILPFFKGIKEFIENYRVKKSLIKTFEE